MRGISMGARVQYWAFKGFILLTLITLTPFQSNAASVWYVDVNSAASSPNGKSWNSAFRSIQEGIDTAVEYRGSDDFPAEIWVAKGVYAGVGGNPRVIPSENQYPVHVGNCVVVLQPNVSIFGGFSGTESVREQRNWKTNVTSINGENINRGIFGADNAVVDGFTIENGQSTQQTNTERSLICQWGGGMLNYKTSPEVRNCLFKNNNAPWDRPTPTLGGAIANIDTNTTITNCSFINNYSNNRGGAIYNSSQGEIKGCRFISNKSAEGGAIYSDGILPSIMNCIFQENIASDMGGAICNHSSSPRIANCLLVKNSASKGGGIYNYSYTFYWGYPIVNQISSPILANCTFYDNTATNAPDIYQYHFVAYMFKGLFGKGDFSGKTATKYPVAPVTTYTRNCIFWGNITHFRNDHYNSNIVYSSIQGGEDGTGNIDADPLFINPDRDNFILRSESPCIDTGVVLYPPETDLRGYPRILGTGVDMGAYETMTGKIIFSD